MSLEVRRELATPEGSVHRAVQKLYLHFLFRNIFYEWIIWAKCKGKLPPGYGTEEHMATVWEEGKRDKVLHHLGEDYSPNRWKNWSDRFAYYHDSFDLLLMVICYI